MVPGWNYDLLQLSGTAVKATTKITKQKSSYGGKNPAQQKQTKIFLSLSRILCSFPLIDLKNQD